MPSPKDTKKQNRYVSALLDDDEGFVRKPQVLTVIPVSERTWDRGVKEGRFPAPVKISARIDAWRVRDIRALLTALSTGPSVVIVLGFVLGLVGWFV